MEQETRIATFGAGCFWHVEAAFGALDGVVSTAVGYMGGTVPDPTYAMVCTDRSGHAEVVHLEYDQSIISYDYLLEVFWDLHDPTSLNRQGPDVGSQYRSVIFYHDAGQEAAARAAVRQLEESGTYNRPIVTEIAPAGPFYRAEEYHQQYFARHFGLSPQQAALACAVGTPAMRHAKKL
jgi:peptide-methionine (S)-S-oxide reductase